MKFVAFLQKFHMNLVQCIEQVLEECVCQVFLRRHENKDQPSTGVAAELSALDSYIKSAEVGLR